jgi:hypothetical protein
MLDFWLIVFFLICFVVFGFLIFQVLNLKKRLDMFLKKGDSSFDKVLDQLVESDKKRKKEIEQVLQRIERLENIAKISIQKIGLVRYNFVKGMGGDQSFSLALLDEQSSGLVITSLYLKKENRIFAKPVTFGKSEHTLSPEEKEAVQKAIKI